MKKQIKNVLLFLIIFCMSISLTACSNNYEEMVLKLVDGNIASVYLGETDQEYLKLVGETKAENEKIYLEGMRVEAEYFAIYWGIIDTSYGESYDDLSSDLKSSIVELYKEIYSHTKYEVKSAAKQDDESYSVKVLVEPINIMELASDVYESGEYEPLNAFWTKYANIDVNAMTDEEYMNYTNEYGEVIVQLVKDQFPNLGYLEQRSQSIQVELVDDAWQINEDDFNIFDSYVISYP